MKVTLVDRQVSVEHLYLDPNNPRFADLGMSKRVPADKVTVESVQQSALAKMLEERFEVDQLQESIEKVGFLSVDRMVVVGLLEPDCYMVIEGNRRLAAVKSLLGQIASGEVDVSEDVAPTLKAIPVVAIEGGTESDREEYARTLQGVRHIAGIKQWGAYQQAQAVGLMLDEGLSSQDVRSALGLTAQRFNLLRSVYLSMRQMREDDEFAALAKPGLFSHFVEALNRPAIRDWVGWNKDAGVMENDDARRTFYKLIVGMEDEEGVTQEPKIIDAKDFRLLPKIMEDPSYFEDFLANPTLPLQDAAKMFAAPPEPLPDWKSILKRDVSTLNNNVPHTAIAAATDDDISLLAELRDLCSQFLHDIELVQES
jgi:hypothetical protein